MAHVISILSSPTQLLCSVIVFLDDEVYVVVMQDTLQFPKGVSPLISLVLQNTEYGS